MSILLKCAICGCAEFTKIFDATREFSIVKCKNCGLWVKYPFPSDENVKNMYLSYHEDWGVVGKDEEMHRKMRYATFDRLLKKADRFKDSGGGRNLLDIGCATGICMEAAERHGWEPSGVDISEKAAEVAMRKFGHRVRIQDFEKDPPAYIEYYDLVIMTDVLEHLKNIVLVMTKVSSILKSDGIVMVVTVDSGSLYSRYMGRNWFNIREEHLFYFSRKNLQMLLDNTGFDIIRMESSYKSVNLYYISEYLRQSVDDFPRLANIFKSAIRFIEYIPEGIKRLNFTIPTGDITIIARKR